MSTEPNDIDNVLPELDPDPPAPTPPDRTSTYLKFFTVFASLLVSPFIAHCITGKVETLRLKFEKDDRARKREAELRIHNQTMRNALVKEFFAISKTADLDNVAHAYRLGWIAELVEANQHIFDLNMRGAKEKLDKIVERLGTVDNIRQELHKTKKTERSLQKKIDKADQSAAELEKQLAAAKKGLEKAQWQGYVAKRSWQEKVAELEARISRGRLRRGLYLDALRRERTRRAIYEHDLTRTKELLQKRVQEAAKQQQADASRIQALNLALEKMRTTSSSTSKELDAVKALAHTLSEAHAKAKIAINDLKDELEKLRAVNKTLADENKKLAASCPTKPAPSMGATP